LVLGFVTWSILTLLWAPNLALGRQELIAHLIGFSLLMVFVNQIDSAEA